MTQDSIICADVSLRLRTHSHSFQLKLVQMIILNEMLEIMMMWIFGISSLQLSHFTQAESCKI